MLLLLLINMISLISIMIKLIIIFIIYKSVGYKSTQGKHSYWGMQVNDLMLIIADPSPF